MPLFHAVDGTELAYHVRGNGQPLICVPGGPMRASACLGDLGGLSAHRRLILLDLRGTGDSAIPADLSSYRCDRLVDDVLALQDHLGLASADVLGHSAGANIAVQYALAHQQRVSRLVLVTPSGRAVGLEPGTELRREIVSQRQGEPWFAAAAAAFERIAAGGGAEADWAATAPFFYGRWDAAAQAYDAAEKDQTNEDAAEAFGADGAFDPAAARAGLTGLGSPVLVIGGGLDLQRPPAVTAEYAALFPAARLIVQPGAGHFPWLDDPGQFVSAVTEFLN
ncbi:MAG TPA: alpha/beta hydrolase [Trebonia sp.]|jgi:pimeloyl-ACP methyl ester carboxylesterase|nr:alpha/beta hydrolase [Trebonia sp.]